MNMWTKIKLQNFRGFKDTGTINLAPLTVFIGPNSGGKSTILQSILLLKQISEESSITDNISFRGDLVDLGNFKDLSFNHDKGFLSIEVFGLVFSENLFDISIPTGFLSSRGIVSEVGLRVNIRLDIEDPNPYISSIELLNNNDKVVFGVSCVQNYMRPRKPLSSESYLAGRYGVLHTWSELNLFEQTSSADFVGEITFNNFLPIFLDKIGLKSDVILKNVKVYPFGLNLYKTKFLGPLRNSPERIYGKSTKKIESVSHDAKNMPYLLYSQYEGQKKPFFEKLSEIGRELEIFQSFEVVKQGTEGFSLYLKNFNSGLEINWKDAGYGVSQILPILVELIIDEEHVDSTLSLNSSTSILVDQPELHLNPRIQSRLADVLINTVMNTQKQVIIETHSEHIINRIASRVVDGKLSKDLLKMYYVDYDKNKLQSSVSELKINDFGQFDGWPKGFFEEDVREGLYQMEKIHQKMSTDA